MTTACTQCGKRTTPDSIHTCSPQVQRDETLPEPFGYWCKFQDGSEDFLRTLPKHPDHGDVPTHAMPLYTEATLREAIKGARKKAKQEMLNAMRGILDKHLSPIGKAAIDFAALAQKTEDEQ